MNITITTKNIELDNPLRVFVEEKMNDLKHLFGTSTEAIVTRVEIGKPSLHHKSGPVFHAEANIQVGGKLLRAEAEHADLRAAITEIKDALKIQITKFKEKSQAK